MQEKRLLYQRQVLIHGTLAGIVQLACKEKFGMGRLIGT